MIERKALEEVEHRHRVPGVAARGNLSAAVAVDGLEQRLDEIGAPAQHLVVDRSAACEGALPPACRGMEAKEAHHVAGVGVVLDPLSGVGAAARRVAEGLAEVHHVVEQVPAGVLRHHLVAQVACDAPEDGRGIAPAEALDGKPPDLDEAEPVDDLRPDASEGSGKGSRQDEAAPVDLAEPESGRGERVRRRRELGDLVRVEHVEPVAPPHEIVRAPDRRPPHRLHRNVVAAGAVHPDHPPSAPIAGGPFPTDATSPFIRPPVGTCRPRNRLGPPRGYRTGIASPGCQRRPFVARARARAGRRGRTA